MANPISPKVVAAAIGAGAGTVISKLIFWIIGTAVYAIPADASHVAEAIAAVPDPITATITLLLVIGGAAFPGYQVTDELRQVGLAKRALVEPSAA